MLRGGERLNPSVLLIVESYPERIQRRQGILSSVSKRNLLTFDKIAKETLRQKLFFRRKYLQCYHTIQMLYQNNLNCYLVLVNWFWWELWYMLWKDNIHHTYIIILWGSFWLSWECSGYSPSAVLGSFSWAILGKQCSAQRTMLRWGHYSPPIFKVFTPSLGVLSLASCIILTLCTNL